MTQPTQAQIEANLKQWDEWYKTLPANLRTKLSISDFRRLGDNFYRIFVLQKATAAAQVGESVPSAWLPPEQFKLAAQVGEMPPPHFWSGAEDVRVATIERCAQVAEGLVVKYRGTEPIELIAGKGEPISKLFAAVLRKLKDAL